MRKNKSEEGGCSALEVKEGPVVRDLLNPFVGLKLDQHGALIHAVWIQDHAWLSTHTGRMTHLIQDFLCELVYLPR